MSIAVRRTNESGDLRPGPLRQIRLAFFDVDGVLTDGTKLYHEDGTVSKSFHDHDSCGLKLLVQSGVEVIIISADARVNQAWAAHQGLPFYQSADKAETVTRILREKECDPESAAYVGDDLRDLDAMNLVGFPMAPPNAAEAVCRAARYRLERQGGGGAGREAAELILRINTGGSE